MKLFLALLITVFFSFITYGQSIQPSGSATFCAGGNTTLSVTGAAAGSSFQWKKDGANTGTNINSLIVSANGDYTVIVTPGSGNTPDTLGPVTVSSTPKPIIDFSFSGNNICSGNNVVFTSNITAGTAPFSYSWDFGDGNTSTNANPVHAFTSLGCGTVPFIVKLSVTDSKGCTNTIVTKQISVLQAPDVQVQDQNIFSPFNNCSNSPSTANPTYVLTVNNISPNAGCINSYNINWGDGSTQNGVSFPLVHTYNTLGAFNLAISAVGSNGCNNTKTYVVVNQSNPAGSLGTLGSTTNLCAPANVPFTISNWTLNSPGTKYVLDFGDGNSVTLNHPLNPGLTDDTVNHLYNSSSCPASSYTATLRVINACDNTPYTAGNIQIRIKPTADFTIVTSPACVSQQICFNDNSTAGGYGPNCSTIATYSWDFGDNSPKSTLANPCHTYAAAGTYDVTLSSTNPCGTTTKTKQVCITKPPAPAFIVDAADVCTPAIVRVTNTTDIFNSCQTPTYFYTVTYTASFCGTIGSFTFTNGSNAASENPVFSFSTPGIYTITQSVTNACGTFTSNKTVSVRKPPVATISLPAYSCGVVNIIPAAIIQSCTNTTLIYAWTFTGGLPATANTANPGTVTFITLGNHPISLSVTNECGITVANEAVVVSIAPDVVVPPNDTLCGGVAAGPYNFRSTIGGTAVYKWTNNNTAIGLPASGTVNIPAFTAINNGAAPVTATIIVTPSVSNCVGQPDTFYITVNPRPAAPLVNPSTTYCQNAPAASLTATASGANTLTWYNNAALTGGTTAAPVPSTASAGTALYYVTQTNSFNCLSAASIININVNPAINGNSIAGNQNICANTTPNSIASGLVSGGNGTLLFQWQSSADNGVSWTNIAGATSNAYTPPVLNVTIQYRRVVSSIPCSDTSNAVTITVQGALTNIDIAVSQIICQGNTPALITGSLPSGGGGGYVYQWESSVDNLNWVNVGGNTQDFQPASLSITTFYRRRVTTPQCSATSNVVTVTVNPTPAGGIVITAPFICVADAGTLSFTATAGTAPYNVVLVVTNPGGATDTIRKTINNNGPATIQVINANSNPGIYSIRLIEIADGKTCISNIISPAITIAILSPIINTIKNDTTICNGQLFTILNNSLSGGSATGIDSIYTFQWQSVPSGFSNWQNIIGAASATLSVSPTVSTCYRRKVKTNNSCEIIGNSVCITVDPGIANNIIAANQQVCVNTPVNNLAGSTATGGNGTYTYSWQTSTDSVSWSAVASSIGYQPPIYAAAGLHYFRRDVASGNCTSSSNIVTISVRPDAKALFSANRTLDCAAFDLSTAINVTALPDSNGLYKWYADGVLFGSNTTGIFPNYTISSSNDTVDIKLVTGSQFGCKPDSIQLQFITRETAVAKFTKGIANGCGPLNVSFNNTSSIINNNIQFFWNFGNGITNTQAQPGIITFNTSPFFNDTTYQVTLKAYNGCDTTVWRDSVKIRSNPKARFGVVTTFGCSPFTVQISNTSLGGPNTYYWDFGNGHKDTTFVNGPLNYTYNIGNAVDTFPIRLIAVNECGQDTQIINIRIAPNIINPQININGSDLFGCTPHIVAFNNATSGATTYTWNFDDGTPIIITNNSEPTVVHSFDNPGVFNVSIAITNGCSDTTVSRQVTVYARPVAAFTTNASVYCTGDTVRVNNTSENGSNYRWFWGDGQTSAGLNPVHVYSAAGDYTILLRVEKTNNSGVVCFDTLVKSITVLGRPDARVQSNIANINCTPFTFNATAPGIINENVNWYISDTTVSPSVIIINGNSASYTFNNAGTFQVKMIAENAAGCKDSTIQTFTVRGTPAANFTPSDIAVCIFDTTVSYLNTSVANDNGSVNYRWLVDGVQLATTGNFTHRYTAPGGTILPKIFTTSLIVTNTVGCSDTAKAVLQMSPSAKAQFSISNPNICVPFIAGITNNSLFTTNYKWFVNGLLTDTTASPTLTITQSLTPYTIRLIADNIYGCKPDTFAVNFTSRIKPKAAFKLNDTLGCTGVLNVATANQTTNANFYVWDWGDNSGTTSITSPTHLYNIQGAYLITLVASDGVCKDTASQAVKISVKPVANFDVSDTLTCDTARVQFINLTTGGSSYVWSFSNGTSSIDVNPFKSFAPSPTPYTVKLVADNGLGCKDSLVKANLIVAKPPPPGDFFISPTPVITIPNYSFSFNNLTPNNSRYFYQWDLGDGTSASTRDVISHKYADTGNYAIRLIVLDTTTNCPDTTIKIARIDGFPGWLYVPNAICPGCIQSNLREFLPKGKGLLQYRLQIFTTWGELIFQTSSLDATGAPNQSWDGRYKGTLVQQDAYVWRIDAKFQNGTEWLGMIYPGEGRYKKAGTVTVVK